jgi:hypothetical protein
LEWERQYENSRTAPIRSGTEAEAEQAETEDAVRKQQEATEKHNSPSSTLPLSTPTLSLTALTSGVTYEQTVVGVARSHHILRPIDKDASLCSVDRKGICGMAS